MRRTPFTPGERRALNAYQGVLRDRHRLKNVSRNWRRPRKKRCYSCHEVLSGYEFNRDITTKDGLTAWCKYCERERSRRRAEKARFYIALGEQAARERVEAIMRKRGEL